MLTPLLSGKDGIDLGEMDFLSPYIKRRICVKGGCGGGCCWRETCRYRSFLEKAQSDKVDFQICNHNYLLADTLHRANGQRPLIPNYQGIVIDEAHKFVQAARQMYGMAVSNGTLSQLAKSIRGLVFAQGQSTAELWRDADKLVSLSAHLFSALINNAPDEEEDAETERFATDIDNVALRRLHVLSELLDRLLQRLHGCQPLQKYRGVYSNVRYQLAQTKTQLAAFLQPDTLVYWLEKPSGSSGEVLLCAIPKRPGDSLYTDLWSKGVPVITSGTMAAVADELERLILAAHGHTAVLFTSYRAMAEVFRLLSRRGLSYPLFLLERGRLGMIERFRQSGNGVLFTSGSMWEGVDLPGDILSLLVIVKLPFAVPDPIGDHERSLFPNGDAYKNAVIVPEMLVKLKQGFGRLIRCESDTGVVTLPDSRVRPGGAYRGRVLAALPDCRVTGEMQAVAGFLREKKPATYFGKESL